MKKKLGVLLIRGGGKEGSKAQDRFVSRLNRKLKKRGTDPAAIQYEYISWHGPTQIMQEKLLGKYFNSGLKIRARKLRCFMLNMVSDIVAYVGEPNKESTSYYATHEQVHNSIMKLKSEVEENAPVIVIASSLGTEIIMNYICDRQKLSDSDPWISSPIERMETLTGVFTLGNINAIYLPAYNIDDVKPFSFPPEQLPRKFKNIARWYNIYDKNDPLGYPLKPVNSYFNGAVTEDIQLNIGNILVSWNPASHLSYWNSGKILKRVAEFIDQVASVALT